MNQNQKSNHGSGFSFGVFLGASLGAGAALLFGTKQGRSFKDKIYRDAKVHFKDKIEDLRVVHPKKVEKLEDAVALALSEARSAEREIKSTAQLATAQAKRARRIAEKRLFVKKGRPLRKSPPTPVV